ncbi:MAG: patatin-like phospholipase family protein [Solirubrobacteraceae bacterium]
MSPRRPLAQTLGHDDQAPREPAVGPRRDGGHEGVAREDQRPLSPSAGNGRPRVAVVLPGGGARGAFEAGALSVLLPALEARGEKVSIICGTSVGGINAALLGSVAALPAAAQADALVARWRSMRKGDVIAPMLGPRAPLLALRALGEMLELPGLRLPGLMDPRPLRDSLERWIDWPALHRNVAKGVVSAICVVATSLERGGPVGFVETRTPLPRRSGGIRYVPVKLTGEHVRASAAIPLLFPPVRVTTPRGAAGDYIDGGTRMNAPLSPALALGADRVIVVGFEPLDRTLPPADLRRPHFADVAANVLDGLLVDQVATDVRRMLAINSFYSEDATTGPAPASNAYRAARGRPPYRRVLHALVTPERRGAVGTIAEEVLEQRYGGLRGLRSPDFLLLSRLLGGGRARARGELLSFLLFDEVFVERLLEAGRAAAERWLDEHPKIWRSQADEVSDFEAGHERGLAEQGALTEFRALRRRS